LNPTDACQGQTYLTTEQWLSTAVGGDGRRRRRAAGGGGALT
jgi:hypothetical protein